GVHYAMKAEGAARTAADVGGLVRFFVTQLSWAQYGGVLGGDHGSPPEWDVQAIREHGNQFLVESLPPDDPLRTSVQQAVSQTPGAFSIADLSDDDIKQICDARAALDAPDPAVHLVASPGLCPRKTLGALSQVALRRSRDQVLGEFLQTRSRELATVQPNAQSFQLFVFGHTHQAESKFSPLQATLGAWQPTAINTGAWQRLIAPVALERWRETCSESSVLTAQPAALPPCYSVVVVPPYSGPPAARLRYWAERSGKWLFTDSCIWNPPV